MQSNLLKPDILNSQSLKSIFAINSKLLILELELGKRSSQNYANNMQLLVMKNNKILVALDLDCIFVKN